MQTIINADEVFDITGVTVAHSDVVQAQVLIETMAGVVLDPEDSLHSFGPSVMLTTVGAKNYRACRFAVAYQAAWAVDQPDLASRMSVNSLSQDGVSVSAKDQLSWVLAPLARRALVNCSWSQDNTIFVAPAKASGHFDFTVDDAHPWSPL